MVLPHVTASRLLAVNEDREVVAIDLADWIQRSDDLIAEDQLDGTVKLRTMRLSGNFGFLDPTPLIISGGEITVRGGQNWRHHTVDTEGAAASDDLDKINGGRPGEWLLIEPEDAARTINVIHSANISLVDGADFSMDDVDRRLLLECVSTDVWEEVNRSYAGSGLIYESTSSGEPIFRLTNINDDEYGPVFEFVKHSATPWDNDSLGKIVAKGYDDADPDQNEMTFAEIEFLATDPLVEDDGSQIGGGMVLRVAYGAGLLDMITLSTVHDGAGLTSKIIFNDENIDTDIIFRFPGEDNGLLLHGAHENVSINGSPPSAHFDLALLGDGVLCQKETATPTADTNYGKLYWKDDNQLYGQDGEGVEHQIAFA